jgi:hypothetical protein
VSAPGTDNPGGPPPLVALATCRDLPAGDEDGPALVAALRDLAITAQWQVWDDPDVDWRQFDVTLIRSTWDYTFARADFLRWAADIDDLHNCHQIVEWNSDKRYLQDLSDAGLPIVATEWLAPGERRVGPPAPAFEFVLKPTVGAGSRGTGRFDPRQPGAAMAAAAHLQALHDAGRTVMRQPYLAGVDTAGEAALVYLGGRFSHAITKQAMLAPAAVHALEPGSTRELFVAERISARTPSPAELALGDRVLAYVSDRFGGPVYARVDLLPGPDGPDRPVVIELELVEPSLFLAYDGDAAAHLAAAVASRLR